MIVFRRVVFDTSTLVSAALRVGSPPHRAMGHTLATGELCVSAATLAELDAVLLRPKFDRYMPVEMRQAFAAFVRHHAAWFEVSEGDAESVNPPCRDLKDNPFLALTQRCGADVLVSSDADLLVMHPWNGVPILTPVAFLLAAAPH